MARPLRVEVEGGWYHVISRGLERRAIFRDDLDRRDFLERLFELRGSCKIKVHGYSLMGNHFHLQVETLKANLKEAMQRLLSGYVVRFNLRHHRAGPLFQGRYRAILAGERDWKMEVNRYIHLNAVRTERLGLGKERQAQVRRGNAGKADPELVKRRLALLRDYAWSSYRSYAGYIAGPEELERSEVLGCFEGRTEKERRRAFREYTEEAIREGLKGDGLMEAVRYGALLGSREWVGKMRGLLGGDAREQAGLEEARKGEVAFKEVTALIADEYGEGWDELKERRGHPARGLAIALCRRHTALKLREIGKECGGMDYGAVSQASRRTAERMRRDRSLRAVAARLEKALDMYNVET